MFKLDPILKDFNLDISKTSKNYLEMKAMLEGFEREYQLRKNDHQDFIPFHIYIINSILVPPALFRSITNI